MSYLFDVYNTGWYYLHIWDFFVYTFFVWVAWNTRLSWHFKPLILASLFGCYRVFQGAAIYTGHFMMTPNGRKLAETRIMQDFQTGWSGAQSLVLVLAACALMSSYGLRSRKGRATIEWGLTLFSILLVSLSCLDTEQYLYIYTMFSNYVLTACVYISLFPIARRKLPGWASAILALMILYTCVKFNKSTLWGMAGFIAFFELFKLSPKIWFAGIFTALTAGVFGAYYFTDELMAFDWMYHWGTRAEIWSLMISTAWHAHPWIGMGGGATWSQVRYLQTGIPHITDSFLMAHNDYVQVFYELGLLGLASALLAFGRVIYLSRKKSDLLLFFVAVGGEALFHFPLHEPIAALILLLVSCLALEAA